MSGVSPRVVGSSFRVVTESSINTTESGILTSPYDDIYTDPGDWRYFGLIVGIIVIILGTAGNGLTVWAYRNNRNLQTSFNVLIANLCCLELIFSLVIIPFQLPGYILQKSPYPDEVCAIIAYLYYSSITASLHNLIAIAINRYVGITNAKWYRKMFTGWRLRIWVISIWLISPLLQLPLIFGGSLKWDSRLLRCGVSAPEASPIKVYNTVLDMIFEVGGLVILVALYSSIIKKVMEVKKKLKDHKKASFRRTTRNRAKVNIQEAGTSATSGDEDYKPSSIISGGFHFRPAKDGKQHDWASGSVYDSDRELGSHMRRLDSDNTYSQSQASYPTQNDEQPPKPKAQKTSLCQTLFRAKGEKMDGTDEQEENCVNITTDEESKKERMQAEETLKKVEPPNEDPPKIIVRNMDMERKEMRRKKSLSAPTLPSMDEIMESARKSSIAVAKNIPTIVMEVQAPAGDELPPMLTRTSTTRSSYKKRFQRSTNGSIRMNKEHTKYLSPTSMTNQLSPRSKKLCVSMPILYLPPEGSHARVGTSIRRIKDQKSKSKTDRRDMRKQKARRIRRRYARERQLVYSSLTICIAFAVCILPASLLIGIVDIFHVKAYAAVLLVLSCISWLHSVVNPFIYGYMNHLYRKEYGRIAKDIEKRVMTCLK